MAQPIVTFGATCPPTSADPERTIPSSSPDELALPAVESFLARRPGRVLVGLVVGAAFVRLILCLQLAAGPLTHPDSFSSQGDDHFFHAWGMRVAEGDLLQRTPWHPMMLWMRTVAERALAVEPGLADRTGVAGEDDPQRRVELLWDRWMGGATFYQEPAYPYLVGATYGLFGPNPWAVYVWQLLLGVAGVVLVHALARRLFSHTAAVAAGVLAVLAPVPLIYEVSLLRDALAAYVGLALGLLMLWAVEGPRRRFLVLGLAFGAAVLVKETFLVFPVVLAAYRLATVRAPFRARLASAGLVLAGVALGVLPAVLRNVAVGAPPLALNGSAAPMLPIFHTVDAQPLSIELGAAYVQAMISGDGRAGPGFLAAIRSHDSLWSFLALELSKLAHVWHSYEAPNNVDFYLFRQAAPILDWLPARVVLLAPLAAIGLLRAPGRAWPLFPALIAGIAGVVLSAALSRYRAPVVVALLPLAGAGLARLGVWVVRRKVWHVGCAALLAAAYVAWAVADPPRADPARRSAEYRRTGMFYARVDERLATLYFLESLRLAPGDPALEARVGSLLLAGGEPDRALPHLDAALRASPEPGLRILRARALAAMGRESEARAELRALGADGTPTGVTLDPPGDPKSPGDTK